MTKHQHLATKSDNIDLPPALVRALKIAAVAEDEFEPFVERLVDSADMSRLIGMGLVENGPSRRPAVGPNGYRLTAQGWEVIHLIWNPAAPDAHPQWAARAPAEPRGTGSMKSRSGRMTAAT
jgi:hypothetical protein